MNKFFGEQYSKINPSMAALCDLDPHHTIIERTKYTTKILTSDTAGTAKRAHRSVHWPSAYIAGIFTNSLWQAVWSADQNNRLINKLLLRTQVTNQEEESLYSKRFPDPNDEFEATSTPDTSKSD
jgi:hypothetical protein